MMAEEHRAENYRMEYAHGISTERNVFMAVTGLLRVVPLVFGVAVAAPLHVMV